MVLALIHIHVYSLLLQLPCSNPAPPPVSPEDRRDFNSTSISVTFQPDEIGDEISTVSVSVLVVNDVIDEATEVFVSTIIDVQASRREVVSIARTSALGSIQDDDGTYVQTF